MKALTPNTFSPALAVGTAVILATLAGCSARHQAQSAPAPQDVTPGSTFTVSKGFLIPDGETSVYFQDARLYPEGEIQPDYPFCDFLSATSGEIIHSGAFEVSKVDYEEDGIGPKGTDVSITQIHLREAATGKTYRMNCMLPLASHGARFITPEEIQGAVGGYMDIEVAP